jgi:hypothetical protein
MKKLLITLLGLGVLGTCQADLLIYKTKVSATITGNAQTKKDSITGFVVIDLGTHQLANIPIVSTSFKIFTFTNAAYAQIDAGKGKRETAVSFSGNGIGAVLATGLNSPLVTGTITMYTAPKTMKVTGTEISNSLSTTEIDTGTLTFDQVDTVTENGLGKDFSSAVSDIEQTLLGRGLIEN